MYLYIANRKVWVTYIFKMYSVGKLQYFKVNCKEGPTCTVPFSLYVEPDNTVYTCDEYGFKTGKSYTGDALFPLMESLINELALEKL